MAGGGGAAPPCTGPPAFRGAPPPGPPKRRSAPLAAAVVRFLATEPLVWGRTCSQKIVFFLTNHFTRAASLPGAELFSKCDHSFEESTCRGQLRCLGRFFFFLKNMFFWMKPLIPDSFASWGRIVSQKSDFFELATCPRQLRGLGQNLFLKMCSFLNKPLVPGSFAAWDIF